MIVEIILALIIGVFAGTFTGLAPGIHINLVATILLSSLGFLTGVPIIALVVFVVAMSITHTFIDFIPSIYLGAPEEDTFLSILPGHQMFLEGKGYQAVVYTLYGSLAALPIILIYTPVFIILLPSFYTLIKTLIPFILIFISVYMVLREESPVPAAIIFILASMLGILTFQLPVKEPLLPLLTGLFGLSSLVISIQTKSTPKPQEITPLKNIPIPKKDFRKAFLSSFITSPLCSFLPGIGSSHATLLSSEIVTQKREGFLFLSGIINTVIMALSFVTVYSINRSRSGSAAAIQELLQKITLNHLIIIILAITLSSILAFLIGIFLAKVLAKTFNKIPYKKLTLFVISFLILINLFFTNPLGLLVLATSTFLGAYCVFSNTRRMQLMGALISPAIVYYLFF